MQHRIMTKPELNHFEQKTLSKGHLAKYFYRDYIPEDMLKFVTDLSEANLEDYEVKGSFEKKKASVLAKVTEEHKFVAAYTYINNKVIIGITMKSREDVNNKIIARQFALTRCLGGINFFKSSKKLLATEVKEPEKVPLFYSMDKTEQGELTPSSNEKHKKILDSILTFEGEEVSRAFDSFLKEFREYLILKIKREAVPFEKKQKVIAQ